MMNLFLQNVVESFMRKNAFSGLLYWPVKKTPSSVTKRQVSTSVAKCHQVSPIYLRESMTRVLQEWQGWQGWQVWQVWHFPTWSTKPESWNGINGIKYFFKIYFYYYYFFSAVFFWFNRWFVEPLDPKLYFFVQK